MRAPVPVRELDGGEKFRLAGMGLDWAVYEVVTAAADGRPVKVRDTESGAVADMNPDDHVIRLKGEAT